VPDYQLITANAVSGQAQNLARLTGSQVGYLPRADPGRLRLLAGDRPALARQNL
jgi:hypothetical protein